MAVVQISRIQLRRGRKNSGTGLPQLASGELAWAVDTQELYIGNGSVGEGAPAVGNTKLLTEKDSLLELGYYSYKPDDAIIQTGADVNFPVERTLQNRLEDTVSSADYGIVSGSADQHEKIQRVIDNLFLDKVVAGTAGRVVLAFQPGEYTFSQTVYLPSYVNIVGAGKQRTVFNFTGTGSAFAFINDTSTKTLRKTAVGITYNLQPKNCYLRGFTVNTIDETATGFDVYSVRDSVFEDIELTGTYGEPGVYSSNGIGMYAFSSVVTCQNVLFNNITVDGFANGLFAKQDIINNRIVNSNVINCQYGILLGQGADGVSTGEIYGPRKNIVEGTYFENIDREGIYIAKGHGNKSQANTFVNVGNDGGDYTNATYSHIKFDTDGNTSIQDNFDRSKPSIVDVSTDLGVNNYAYPYVKEVSGKVHFEEVATRTVVLTSSPTTFQNIIRIPFIGVSGFEITYLLKNSALNQTRRGKISVVVIDNNPDSVQLVDEYEYFGTATAETNIEFRAQAFSAIGSLVIQYKNTNVTNANTELTYSYRSIS
jgi:hypothetical protein